ncbi:hypothetical protein JCM11641_008248 [Rhodosporidiobolus odoratus]
MVRLGPGDTVDRDENVAYLGPGDSVTPETVVVSPRRGDSDDAAVDGASPGLGDSVDLGAGPDRDDVGADATDGCKQGSLLAIASIGALAGERRDEREFTGSPDYSSPNNCCDTPEAGLRHSLENGNPGGTASEDERKGEEPFTLFTSPRPATPSEAGSTSGKRRRKRRNRRKKTPICEPEVAERPLSVEVILDGVSGVALTDSGSQADVLSSEFALKNGLELRRLVAPVHADLGADGHSVRLAIFTAVPCSVGPGAYESRSFFVGPLPSGIDVILGVPWMRDSNVGVSASTLSFIPEGPSEDFYDFKTGQFALQPQKNLDDLGFVQRPMTADESTRFFFCALAAGVPGLEDFVDYEPHNPLLDEWQDDPSLPDLSKDEAAERLAKLRSDFADVFVDDLPDCLPPFRPINHDIHEVVEGLKIPPRVIGMPDRYSKQWTAHLLKFVETGYWSPKALDLACSMFAVPKHDPSQARFVINLKPRNANTVRTASPIPDMRQVRANLASHPVRSKLDFKKAYEQIRLNWESVERSGFVTKNGTFISRVMQQGDCNAPDTMHRVCYMMFSKAMGRFVDTFYDDIFIYSHTRTAHLRYLEIVFTTLRHYKFYLANDKVELMAPRLEALGAIITDEGLEVDPKKWSSVQDWPRPKTPRDILRFLGVVQWMGDHLPHLNELASPLTRLTGKVDWDWSPACNASVEAIKQLVPLKLCPLNFAKLESGAERLFLFTDASVVGSGGWIGQGTTGENARPFRFHSAKFNSAQLNYTTTDQELLAVLDCCLKFRDHLIGWEFTVVCDHEPLKTYHTQPPKQTRRHVRMWETLSEFHFTWEFLPGKKNGLADSLSRLAELMASEGNLSLPEAREPSPAEDDNVALATSPSRRAELAMGCLVAALRPCPVMAPVKAGKSFSFPSSPSLSGDFRTKLTISLPQEFLGHLPALTAADTQCKKILANPEAYPSFLVEDGLVYASDDDGLRLVVPRVRTGPRGGGEGADDLPFSPVKAVIKLAHQTVGHQSGAKTLGWARRFFWWATMHADVFDYVAACEPCCRGKALPAKPYGFLHPLDTPPRPWSWATIDFVVGLPPVLYDNRLVDQILTATCPLSKMVVRIPLPSTSSAEDVAQAFYDSVYRRFGSQASLVSDRDPKFTSRFWTSLHKLIGTSLRMSSSAHPQTDGRSEVTNKSVGQALRILCADNPDDWAGKITAVEFALNSAPAAATRLSPFEVVYGFLPSPWPSALGSTGDPVAGSRVERARLDWLRASDAIISARVDMVHQENKHRRSDSPLFAVGNKVYVSTSGMRFPPGLPHKFLPRFVGPFPITAANPSKSNYTISFPPHLRLHPTVHASKLRPHFSNDDDRFPSRAFTLPPPLVPATDGADAEWEIEKVVAVKSVRGKRMFKLYPPIDSSSDRRY